MKYVLIFVAVVILVRIDVVLSLFDKASKKLSRNTEEVIESDSRSERELISFKEDQSIKQTPKKTFFSLLIDFVSNPSADNRLKALTILKSNPSLLTAVADPELESVIYQWRDLLIAKNEETITFLIELQNVLQGENLEMVKRFTSLLMDEDLDFFLKYYVRSKDTNCSIAVLIGDNLPAEERVNEFYDRESRFNAFLAKAGVDPVQKMFVTNCLMALRLKLDTLTPAPTPPPVSGPESEPTENSLPTGNP